MYFRLYILCFCTIRYFSQTIISLFSNAISFFFLVVKNSIIEYKNWLGSFYFGLEFRGFSELELALGFFPEQIAAVRQSTSIDFEKKNRELTAFSHCFPLFCRSSSLSVMPNAFRIRNTNTSMYDWSLCDGGVSNTTRMLVHIIQIVISEMDIVLKCQRNCYTIV